VPGVPSDPRPVAYVLKSEWSAWVQKREVALYVYSEKKVKCVFALLFWRTRFFIEKGFFFGARWKKRNGDSAVPLMFPRTLFLVFHSINDSTNNDWQISRKVH